MNSNAKLATVLFAVAALGCRGTAITAVGGGDGADSMPASAATATPGGAARVENIVDTTMDNKIAEYVTIPAKWKFEGVLLQGGKSTCESYAFAVYRASSADGQSFGEEMPQMMWAYGNGPKPASGCLPLSAPMSAQEFLKYISTTMQVQYVSDAPVPAALAAGVKHTQASYAQQEPFYAAHNLPVPKNTADGAAAEVRYKSGSVEMKGRLTDFITCTETTHPGMKSMLRGMPDRPASTIGKCTASVAYVSAPANAFAEVVRLWDSPGMGFRQNKEWGDAWSKRYAEQGNAATQQLIGAVSNSMAEQRQEIQHTMAVQQKVHDQFLQTMQAGTQASMDRAAESANSNHRMAQDMVDYSLDRQTVLDTTTGTYYKVSNQLTPGGTVAKTHADGTIW